MRLRNLLMNMETLNKKYAFFTIDVERFIDTECVYKAKQPVKETMLDGLERYMEILDKHNIKATLFVLSELADSVKDVLKKYINNGHKIALHGKRHVPPVMMDNEFFREQILSAKTELESVLDVPVIGYRAPCFSIDREKIDILEEIGFKYDASKMEFSGARHNTHIDMHGFTKIASEIYRKENFFEFGISTQKIFGKNFPVSGGGYLRISNWLFAQTMVNRCLKNSNYYVFYLHPFELSKKKIPWIKNLNFRDKYYLNSGHLSYPYKIEYIIKKIKKYGYSFSTFEDIVNAQNDITKNVEI